MHCYFSVLEYFQEFYACEGDKPYQIPIKWPFIHDTAGRPITKIIFNLSNFSQTNVIILYYIWHTHNKLKQNKQYSTFEYGIFQLIKLSRPISTYHTFYAPLNRCSDDLIVQTLPPLSGADGRPVTTTSCILHCI